MFNDDENLPAVVMHSTKKENINNSNKNPFLPTSTKSFCFSISSFFIKSDAKHVISLIIPSPFISTATF